jgi:hypothetical protein
MEAAGNRMIERAFDGNFVVLESPEREASVVYTKVQLQDGARKVQQGAATAASGVSNVAQTAAQQAAQTASEAAAQAAQTAALGAQQAAASLNAGLRAGSLSARSWMAPRLENAADFTTATMAPAVSDALVKNVAPRVAAVLRNTARQVSPEPERSRSSLRSVITWTALSAAVLAGAGAVGTLVWRRYRAAMAADTEPDTESRVDTEAEADNESDAVMHGPENPDAVPVDEASKVTDADASVPRPAKSTW